MNLLILCASEFATKLVAGLSGIIFAGIIVVCLFVGKNKKSSDNSSLEAKAKKQNEELKNALPESKKGKKTKKAQAKENEQDKNQEDKKSNNTDDK